MRCATAREYRGGGLGSEAAETEVAFDGAVARWRSLAEAADNCWRLKRPLAGEPLAWSPMNNRTQMAAVVRTWKGNFEASLLPIRSSLFDVETIR